MKRINTAMAMFAIGVAAATAQVATMNLSGSVPAELNGKKCI